MKYVCKCGRIVNKSTSADNTGNRDTAGCDGCPYLLPWGPFQWDETRHAMVTEIKGYECRMSPALDYATHYQGSGSDKCVLHIYSLDYDFLERVAAWSAEHFPEKEISCNFSRDKIRAVEFIGGLYRMSVYPMQNKKGIAAKAALLEHFFNGNGARKDMTPEEEKNRILAAIEDGKARAQKKETDQMNPIISENLNNGGTYAYYAGRFWVYGKTANEWFVSDLAAEEYQKARKEDEDLTPEDFMASSDVFVQMEDWEITTEMVNSLMRTAESVHPKHADEPEEGRIGAGEELIRAGTYDRARVAGRARAECGRIQALHVCPQKPENIKIWLNAMMPLEYWVMNKSGNPCGEHIETCPYCGAALKDGCGDVLVVPYGIAAESQHEDEDAALSQLADKEDSERKDATCCCETTSARTEVTAVTLAESAAPVQSPKAEISPDSSQKNTITASSCPSAEAAQSRNDSSDIVTNAPTSAPPSFDYTGMDDQTVADLHLAEREYLHGRKMAEMGLRRMADGLAIAHDTLCGTVVHNVDNGQFAQKEDTFRRWCESIGVGKSTAYKLLQVSNLFDRSTPREQKVLEELSPSLLYAAAKPSAPSELVQAVKDRDITTHKQYQEALEQLKAAQEARQQAEAERDEARREAETAARKARKTEKERDGARDALRVAKARGDKWQEKAEGMSAQMEQMRAAPIDAAGADADRVEELVQARLKELSARREPDEDEDARAHHAYDAFILASRSMDSVWKTLKPLAADLAPGQAGAAGNLLVQKLTEIREDVIHVCENRES